MKPITPDTTTIGWIGTGVMGLSMCSNLMDAGYKVNVFSRTQSKADSLVSRGAKWCESPKVVASCSDVIFSIVGFPSDVRAIHLGPAGTLAGATVDSVIVDMTTSEPSLAIEIAAAALTKGIHAIDAPVSGGDVGARQGTLSIMIGGDPTIVEALSPLFEVMGKTVVHQGPGRRRPTYKNGQSNVDRDEYDRGLRSVTLRPQSWPRFRDGDEIRQQRRRRQLVFVKSWSANYRKEF